MSKSTVKRLCDSGELASTRTPGGHRRIARSELQRWASLNGIEIRFDSVRRGGTHLTSESVHDLLIEGDGLGLAKCIGSLLEKGRPLAQIFDETVAPACWEIGRRWEKQELDTYEEHARSRTLGEALTHLRSQLGVRHKPVGLAVEKYAIGAALGSEMHHMTSSMIELVLAEAGWSSKSLGAMLPVDSLMLAIRRASPTVVWVTYTHIDELESVVDDNHRLFSMLGPHQRLLIGGQALTREVRRRLRFHFAGDSLCHLMDYLGSLEIA